MSKDEKRIEDLTESEIKEMWKEMFVWVVENRLEWLEEIIVEKKQLLKMEMFSKT